MVVAWTAALVLALWGEGPPRPWDEEIVYAIILEKFADGDPANNIMARRFGAEAGRYEGGFRGGDLRGVLDHLGDIADLGVTAILLYPVMQNDERPVGKFLPTGYRPKDYERVDENFGDLAALRAVVDAAHARGLRVILDMPITLPGFEHPFLADPGKKDWFGPPTEYGVPRWKAENPEVADYLIGVARRWKERSGCDGFRLDSAHLQPVAFWKRFVAELKAAPPAGPFVILPELTIHPREIGRFVAGAGFDGAYDFSAMRAREVFGKDDDVGLLSFVAREAKEFYPAPRSMMAPIDNYEDAFVSVCKEPRSARARLALAFLLTLDRVPLLYAGNELGIAVREVGDAFPADRRDSPFLADAKRLIALRRREPALARGDFAEVHARDGLYAFVRAAGDDRVLVVLNGSARPRDLAAPLAGRPWDDCRLHDLIADAPAKPAGAATAIRVEPYDARILKVE